ncbi:MAG: hypothetical protein N2201_02210 [candidate division WOR-3 bacterium]|nr:hypothetical protein [candidate division WOR-3 bacterium]
MSIESNIIKTTCPFCVYGCELSIAQITRGDFSIRKIEYDRNSVVNQGRLCTRGNLATKILEDKKRLASPLLNNNSINWQDAIAQISANLSKFASDEIAITYDINNSLEELSLILNFAQQLKIDTIARSYVEPEAFFNYTVDKVKYAELKDISSSKVFLIIGDIFSKTPLIAKPILDAKYADRNHRLYYIDSVKSKIAGFANKFLQVKPGTEPILLLALIAMMGKQSKELLGDKTLNNIKKILPQLTEICRVNLRDVEEIAKALSNISPGVILTSIDWGKTEDPLLYATLPQLLSIIAPDKKFCALSLTSLPLTKTTFGEIIDKINQEQIKVLINFGEIFPFYYPNILDTLNKLKLFITTATYRRRLSIPNYTLPVPSLLEKSGTLNSLWGKNQLNPLAPPVSGSKSITDIINLIKPNLSLSHPKLTFKTTVNIENLINRAISFAESHLVATKLTNGEFIVLGEESAFSYRGILEDDNKMNINPVSAQMLQIRTGDKVNLTVDNKTKEFIVEITDAVPVNAVSISTNTPENRMLFPLKIDNFTKEIIMPMAKGRLTK